MAHNNGENIGDIKFSVLDLVPVAEGSTALQSIRKSLELAQHVESLGFEFPSIIIWKAW